MIVFYKKNDGQIFSVIEGRVHDNPEKMMIQISGVEPENIGKYIIPYKQKLKEIDVPTYKLFLVDEKTGEVERRQVGTEKQNVPYGLEPDVKFFQLILDFESKKEDIYNYKVTFDENQNPIGFEKTV